MHSRQIIGLLVCALGAGLFGRPVAADTLAYVRASSQYQRDTAISRYHPLNLLDDNAGTIWCEGNEGLGEGEEIIFYFKKDQPIDRIVIGPASNTGRLIRAVRVSDGANSLKIEIGDTIVERLLRSPLSGSTYTVSIEQVGGANQASRLGSDVACLSEILFYYKKRLFGGRTPTSKLRYDKWRDRILGRWSGAPLGAPEMYVIFALDGTWEWNFEPLLGGKTERRSGEYRFRGNRLLMRRGETGRWTDMGFKYERIRVDPDDIGAPLRDYDRIRLNKGVGEKIANDYNNAEF